MVVPVLLSLLLIAPAQEPAKPNGKDTAGAAEKDKEMTEDERDKGKEEVQTLLKTYEDKITELADKKTKEVMEQ